MHRSTQPSRSVASAARRYAAATALVALGLLGGAGSALAANAEFDVTVEKINDSVSVSRTSVKANLTTYAAYRVTLFNHSGNTTNAIVFYGSTNVTGDLTAPPPDGVEGTTATAPFVESNTSACAGTGTSFNCSIKQMKDGTTVSFVLVFSAPLISAAAYWANPSTIDFNWNFNYSSGNSSATPSSLFCNLQQVTPPCNGTLQTTLVTTQSEPILQGFVTYIPSFGGTFFNGNGASALPSDPTLPNFPLLPTALAILSVPNGENLSTATLNQTVGSGGLTGDTTTTVQTIITVPNNDNTFAHVVTIELRRDSSTITKGAKIDNAKVLYAHDDVTYDQNGLPACVNHVPSPPSLVCIDSRHEFVQKDVAKGQATADDVGDWQFIIKAFENGGFKF